jgi:hypothetical protein
MSEIRANSDEKGSFRKLATPDELAELLSVPVTWVYDHTRERCEDPIPCQRLGKYVRFDLEDPRLEEWLARQRRPSGSIGNVRSSKKRGESRQKEEA